MIYVPLIFFSIIFLFIIKKRGLDASAYITLLYIVISIFSIIMYNTLILDEKHKDISIIASITYCLLIGISIIPIYRFNTAAINNIKIPSIKLINILTYIYVCNVIFNLLVYWKDILFILNYLENTSCN